MSPISLTINTKCTSSEDIGDGTFRQNISGVSPDGSLTVTMTVVSKALLFNTDEVHALSISGQ